MKWEDGDRRDRGPHPPGIGWAMSGALITIIGVMAFAMEKQSLFEIALIAIGLAMVITGVVKFMKPQ